MKVLDGILHKVPNDIHQALITNTEILVKWNKLTPIQRNEWICWITIVKKTDTRTAHIQTMLKELSKGKRKPCCWAGCPHRRSSAQKWFKKLIDENNNTTS
jgi:hypothetical protein